MTVEFEINDGQLQSLVRKEQTRLVIKAQRATLNAAKVGSPVDTGFMRNSHAAGPIAVSGDTVRADITVTAKYAMAVHEGSRPHVIRPRRAKVLAWKGGGGTIFARSVNHPGAKKRPWLLNALRDSAATLGFEVSAEK